MPLPRFEDQNYTNNDGHRIVDFYDELHKGFHLLDGNDYLQTPSNDFSQWDPRTLNPQKEIRTFCTEILYSYLARLKLFQNDMYSNGAIPAMNITPIPYVTLGSNFHTIRLKLQDTRYAVLESGEPNNLGFQNTHHARVYVQLLKEILRGDTLSPWSHPYGHMWTPGLDGTYTIQARARDNSGNLAWSKAVSVTSTTGSTPPYTNILYPQEVAEANATVVDGVIQKVNIKRKGKHHMELPEIEAVEDFSRIFTTRAPCHLIAGKKMHPGSEMKIMELVQGLVVKNLYPKNFPLKVRSWL